MDYQIGEFSIISRLSIKTLRYYHEAGLLEPSFTAESGYRYYNEQLLERARIIGELKSLDFSIKEIKAMMEQCTDDRELLLFLKQKTAEVSKKIAQYNEIQRKLEVIIKQEEAPEMVLRDKQIVIKNIPDLLVASIRFKGRYSDVGQAFTKLMRYGGKCLTGSPFSLYYDGEYIEDDADIEACIPIKQRIESPELELRELVGGKALTVVHSGPYETIGTSYKILFDYINQVNIKVPTPFREVYVKGPGMILPRSPKKFITEIQMLI